MASSSNPAEYPLRLTVEGECFVVEADPRQSGAYHYDWVSGPNAQYGFSSRSGVVDVPVGLSENRSLQTRQPTLDEHVAAIGSFLSEIDPHTGYIAEP